MAVTLLANELAYHGTITLALMTMGFESRGELREKKERRIEFIGRVLGVAVAETATFLKIIDVWGMVFGAMITSAMLGTWIGRRFMIRKCVIASSPLKSPIALCNKAIRK